MRCRSFPWAGRGRPAVPRSRARYPLTRIQPGWSGLAALVLLGVPGLGVAQQAPPVGRWEVVLRGPLETGQSGELHLAGGQGHLLLETHDTVALPVVRLRLTGDSIHFDVPTVGFHFAGVRPTDSTMSGVVQVATGGVLAWQSWALPAGRDRWPIRPRVSVPQLHIGRMATTVEIPGGWVAATSALPSLAAAWRDQHAPAGLPVPALDADPAVAAVALGLDPATRAAGRRLWQELATETTDTAFRRLFGQGDRLLFDLHDYAMAHASRRMPGLGYATIARALRLLGAPVDSTADSLATLGVAWGLWNRQGQEPALVAQALIGARSTDVAAITALQFLLEGYDRGEEWWQEAVRWALTAPWLTTPSGSASPATLVARFWDQDQLPLPPIVPVRFGGFEAYAYPGLGPLAASLVTPASLPGRDWLARHGSALALQAWRRIGGATDSLVLMAGPTELRLTSPAGWSRVHGAPILPTADLVRIDPGIAPLFAVTTLLHEWQHLLFAAERHRLLGVRRGPLGVRWLDEDPWLNEGAAEWATEAVLREAGPRGALLRLLDAAKRRTAEQQTGDSPHAIGYRLVRAAAQAVPAGRLRALLARQMQDPQAVARALGLDRASTTPGLRLARPLNASVVPGVTFTWDAGFADAVRRTLQFPSLPLEF